MEIGELRRHPEPNIFGYAGQYREFDLGDFAEPGDHLRYQFGRSGSASRDADCRAARDPARIEGLGIFDQIARDPALGGDLAQPIRVRAVWRAPTTKTTSTISASSRAARWRFCVA